MDYQIIVNQTPILSGNLTVLAIIAFIILLIIIYGIIVIVKKLKGDETLKYEFVTIIAHKFRTPLSQIKWLSETIKEGEQDSYKKESLTSLEQANEKLISLTNTLVEITDSANKSSSLYNLEKINICEMTTRVTNALKADFHEKNLFFSMQCSTPEIFVNVDRPRMEFVLQTILENTIHYSPPGRNVEIIVSSEKKKAFVQITDHGIGIDPAHLSRIFTKFFRASNAQAMDTEGFGVGLFLAKSIIRRHNGKIDVSSEGLDKGTTITISLPVFK